jgi:protein AFG1
MQSLPTSTGLTITNPLVLYRALLATKQIDPDPAQHRLALHLQKLYHRLKDYEPEVDFNHRLEQLNRSFGKPSSTSRQAEDHESLSENGKPQSIFSSLRGQKEKAEAMALTKKLTNHESAIRLQSPQGLLLYGEVGTGKSMLVDLLADCLPNRKKRRWHFNTFMLETFARLEQLRRSRLVTPALVSTGEQEEEHSLLWLARDMISTSPILFLDEFQLPDRAASKILSNLFTSFFHLGGVLIATSNRVPEELANASGIEFTAPPSSRLGLFGTRWGILGSGKGSEGERSESMFSGKGDFVAFLEVLRARCEIWDIEGAKDWRRREAEEDVHKGPFLDSENAGQDIEQGFEGLEAMASGNLGLAYEQSLHVKPQDQISTSEGKKSKNLLPKNFFVIPPLSSTDDATEQANRSWQQALHHAVYHGEGAPNFPAAIDWGSTSLRVYGRNIIVPRQCSGVTYWTFAELCSTNLGPADYITLASTFHTLILTDVPVLTLLQKNEARRLITLLDALYEARCKLLIRAEAGPDDLFFPETRRPSAGAQETNTTDDSVYSETFSEIYQDQTSPFRPNISSYTSSASPPSYASSPLPSSSSQRTSSSPSTRSILADEDSDFGPVYGAGRSPNSRFRGPSDGAPGAGNEIGRQEGPDFGRTGSFTGEDERFAYKRARSRLWEMCGKRWWDRQEEGWWRPVGKAVRRWEGHESDIVAKQELAVDQLDATKADPLRQTSPFRTSQEPPPKIGWVHAWGMMKWGKKAGAWGKGVEGLQERERKGGKGES